VVDVLVVEGFAWCREMFDASLYAGRNLQRQWEIAITVSTDLD
jgi:hypothetical protein